MLEQARVRFIFAKFGKILYFPACFRNGDCANLKFGMHVDSDEDLDTCEEPGAATTTTVATIIKPSGLRE